MGPALTRPFPPPVLTPISVGNDLTHECARALRGASVSIAWHPTVWNCRE